MYMFCVLVKIKKRGPPCGVLRGVERNALAPKPSHVQKRSRCRPIPKTVEQIERRNSLILKAFFHRFCSCSNLPIERGQNQIPSY